MSCPKLPICKPEKKCGTSLEKINSTSSSGPCKVLEKCVGVKQDKIKHLEKKPTDKCPDKDRPPFLKVLPLCPGDPNDPKCKNSLCMDKLKNPALPHESKCAGPPSIGVKNRKEVHCDEDPPGTFGCLVKSPKPPSPPAEPEECPPVPLDCPPPPSPKCRPRQVHSASIMKQTIADKNLNRPASDIKLITEEDFSQIDAEDWRKCCKHVIKIEDDFIKQDRIITMLEERFIINTSLSSLSDEEQEIQVEFLESFSISE